MRGYAEHALWRDEILAGKRIGPYIYSSGPVYDGEDPTIPDNDNEILHTEEDVEAAIRYVKEHGFLWMKTYPSIEPELYRYPAETVPGGKYSLLRPYDKKDGSSVSG